MGLLRLLAIFFIIYLVMKLFRMYVVPFLFKKATDKMRDSMENRMHDFQAQTDGRAEGDVRVERKGKDANQDRVEEGDYVDFEEVD